jgi:hypothetical protein
LDCDAKAQFIEPFEGVPVSVIGYELRVASLRGTGIPDSRRVYDNEDVDGVAPSAAGRSPIRTMRAGRVPVAERQDARAVGGSPISVV